MSKSCKHCKRCVSGCKEFCSCCGLCQECGQPAKAAPLPEPVYVPYPVYPPIQPWPTEPTWVPGGPIVTQPTWVYRTTTTCRLDQADIVANNGLDLTGCAPNPFAGASVWVGETRADERMFLVDQASLPSYVSH